LTNYGVGDQVGQGNLDLTYTTGLNFSQGNGADEYKTIYTGLWGDVMQSLQLMTFTELRLFWGAWIRFKINDLGHYGADLSLLPDGSPLYTYGNVPLLIPYGEQVRPLPFLVGLTF